MWSVYFQSDIFQRSLYNKIYFVLKIISEAEYKAEWLFKKRNKYLHSSVRTILKI